eukprot:g17360.t1
MQQVATSWDPKKNTPLLGFDCVSLGPTEFKELFRRNFGVLLHPRDLGILVSMYDKRGEDRADSAEFLKDFWQIGREGRERQARKRLQTVRKLNAKQIERSNARAERMSRLKEVSMGQHTEDDVRSAVAKLTEVAGRYVVSRDQGFHQLEQGGVMGPTMFREQLRTIFGLKLSRAEVAGLVSVFDLHRDGMIDAKAFAFRFHALGRDSHAAIEAEGQARNESVRRRKKDREDALLAKLREHSKCKVNWNFSEEELERGKKMIAKAASTYDKARLGADIGRIAQMKMDPTAFRAQLLQNFRVRLGPGELGAVFTAFDKDNSKLIDGTEVVWPSLKYDPFDDDYSMDDHATLPNTAGGASVGGSTAGSTTTGKSGNGDAAETPGGTPARRGRPKISASTAEFLAKIRKEEMTIRAMTCSGSQRRRDGGSGHSGGKDSRAYFSPNGGRRTTTAAGSRSPPPSAAKTPAAPRRASSTPQGDKENAHPCRRRRRRRSGSVSAMGGTPGGSPSKATVEAEEGVEVGATETDAFASDERLALSGSLATRSGSWVASGMVSGRDGSGGGGRSMLESRGGDSTDGPGGGGGGGGGRQSRSSSNRGGGRGVGLGFDPEWGGAISEHGWGDGDGGGGEKSLSMSMQLFCTMVGDIFEAAAKVKGFAPTPAIGNNDFIGMNVDNDKDKDNDKSVNNRSNNHNSDGGSTRGRSTTTTTTITTSTTTTKNNNNNNNNDNNNNNNNNNNNANANADNISGDLGEEAGKDKIKELVAFSPSSITTTPLSPPSSRVALAQDFEEAHNLDPEDYDAFLEFLNFGEDDEDDEDDNDDNDDNDDSSLGKGSNNNGDNDNDNDDREDGDGGCDDDGDDDEEDGDKGHNIGILSTGTGGDRVDQHLGQDPSSFFDGLDFEFDLDDDDDDPSGSFISLLPKSTATDLLPAIPSFDDATAPTGPQDDDEVWPTEEPAVTPVSFPANNSGATREDADDGTSILAAAAATTAGPSLALGRPSGHLPCPRLADPVPAASGTRTRTAAPTSIGAEAATKSENGRHGMDVSEEAAETAGLMLASDASAGHSSPPAAAPVSAGGDSMEESWGGSGPSREKAAQDPIPSVPALSLQDLRYTSFVKPGPGCSFPSTVQETSMPPTLVYRYEDFDVGSVLGAALDVTLHISQEKDGRTTDFSRAVSHRHAQSQITGVLAAAAYKTHPQPAPPSMNVVADALADCMEHQLLLKEQSPSEVEDRFSDGVAVRGNLGRAIANLKEEESLRREKEARATLADVKRRSRSRRLRPVGVLNARARRERATPTWDYLSLRKKWKDGDLLTL